MILSILERNDLDPEVVEGLSQEIHGRPMSDLGKMQVSAVIGEVLDRWGRHPKANGGTIKMKRRKRNETLSTALAFVIAALAGATAYLFAPIVGRLILGALAFVILFRVVEDRRFPNLLRDKSKSDKKKKGGERKWFPY